MSSNSLLYNVNAKDEFFQYTKFVQNGILFLVLYVSERNIETRARIFQSISDNIDRFPRIVFMGDLNEETNCAPDFFEARGMTRLHTDPTFFAVRNQAPHYNDQIW